MKRVNKKLKLVKASDEVLHKQTEVVTDPQSQVFPYIGPMRRVMKERGGVAIAANQIGIPYRFFVDKSEVYINPTIEVLDEETIEGQEGCLSLPGQMWICKRYKKISMTYETTKGKEKTVTVELPVKVETRTDQAKITRLLAFQHEVDHLNGRMIADHGKKVPQNIGRLEDEIPEYIDTRNMPVVSLATLQAAMAKQQAKHRKNQD